ncbi:iron complex outermembrane receptor protein [Novosphingobium taihuense]|uniref:Iron complex outermembrane receptor protein n=2 Tax=Novosphingobium taihuense TaxID=260085 RepID=A0A7W7EWA1_9SPHN|nr:iron complex outermembrane receptor protein [Novosphingobium taihuense]TWH86910.1 iron complex outermembrane receptor protein [Novosphingobium taihuense]
MMKARHFRTRLLRGSILGLSALSLAPMAQAEEAEEPQATGQSASVQEIIVTAQRREESLQKVPVAVTAIGTEQLEALRVTSVRNLAGLAPSLQFNNQGQQSNPTIIIRGVASGTSSNSVDPKVGMYIDGVYIGRAVGSLLDFSDIQRVEVLRGPQGTLFGRNATSGAISIVTAAPKGEWGVRATTSYGNYDAFRGKVSLDLPQIGPFSIRLSYLHDQIDGDVTNTMAGKGLNIALRAPEFGTQRFVRKLGHRNVDGGQIAVRGEFGALTADYRFDYTDTRASGRAMQSLGVIPDASGQLLGPIVALQPFFGGTTNEGLNGPLSSVAAATSEEHVVTQGHSLTLTLEANDNLTVKSISAYRKFRQDPVIFDLGSAGGMRFTFQQLGAFLTPGLTPQQIQAILFNPANAPGPNDYFFPLLSARATRQEQFSQELQFQLSNDSYQLTAGLFYFHEKSPGTEVLGILSPTPSATIVPSPLDNIFGSGITRTEGVNDSMAGYAQLTWHLSDSFDLTGGLRGTIDDRELKIFAISGAQGGSLGVGDYKATYKKLTWTGIATWRPNEQTTLFAKIATGYVSGGILSGIPYRPENLTSYELGAKTQFLDNKVRLNVAAYYNDYKDLQTQNFINGRQFFDNAGKAKIKGFEAELDVVPVAGLNLSGSVSYTDFDYKQFILNGQDVAAFARPTYFSKWTGRAAATYNSPDFTSNGGHVSALIEGRYRSTYYLTSTPLRNILTGQPVLEDRNRQPGYWLVNGRLGVAEIGLGGARVSLSVFGDNIFDKRYIAFGAPVLLFTGTYERGRTYGVELGVNF